MKTNIITTSFVGLVLGAITLAISPKTQATELTNAVYSGLTVKVTGQDYYDYAKMTNPPSPLFWLPPLDTNATWCTFTTNSVPAGHLNWRITSLKSGTTNYLIGTNSLTFPVVATGRYQILCEDQTPPSLTNGTVVKFKGTWGN